MAPPNATVGNPLPTLHGMFVQLKTTFAQHVEVADGPQSRLLRVAGLELPLPPDADESRALLDTVCERLAEVAAFGITSALTDASAQGTRQRMELVSALAMLEATAGSLPAQAPARRADAASDLLTTAEVAAQLGMSRPYVSMLCDQGKLGEVTRSEGGHRRIARQAVDDYLRTHVQPPNPSL
ncbi:MAG: helix-turn-helix domain-containing protein [Burkholderiaceae bacterium]|nr:helix-turn-helix domain-containing protein [Burkholderiaceae bacterium]